MIDSRLAKLPMDRTDAVEPMLPMLRNDPADPMDSTEPVEPILSTEWGERKLHSDDRLVMGTRQSCHGSCEHGPVMDRDQLFDEYDTTIVSVLDPAHGWTDPALVAIERRQSAVVMTAWNPGLARPSDRENRLANERLQRELAATGLVVWRADGRAPDGSALEEGWIIWDMPIATGITIAARFGQIAVYLFDDAGMRQTVACPA